MARKRASENPQPEPELLVGQGDAAAKIDEQIAKGEQLLRREVRTKEELEACKSDYNRWTSYNEEFLRRLFSTPKYADEYSWWGLVGSSVDASLPQRLEYLREDIERGINRLKSIRDRLELIPLALGVKQTPVVAGRAHTNRAFVVHGHDEAVRESVARFLEQLNIEAIILHEQASGGRTVVEKLEHYSDVDFAVILLTPDDIGGVKGTPPERLQARARQNVVLELGLFVGKLGRNHVCALYKDAIEMPSDYVGVVYVRLDDAGGWRLQLAKELRAAGFAVNMNLVV